MATMQVVRIRVQACGICHSDSLTKMGAFTGIAITAAVLLATAPRGKARFQVVLSIGR